ncbi:MAG: S41 family peptidase [Bacteroidaceae bacterium]|jgi:hypothetical protein
MKQKPFTFSPLARIFLILTCVSLVAATLFSCIDEDSYDDDPVGNFEALWQLMDEHYCFFDYKQVDWDSIHSVYASRVRNDMSNYALFDTLAAMLAELKDGHVNLYAAHDMGRYWSWYEDYPVNFYEDLQRHYLGTDYRIAGNIRYTIIEPDSIGYMYCPSFSSGFGDANVDEVLYYFRACKGLILDMRSNSGGALTYAERLASHFNDKRYLAGYIQHKTGKGHNDFSEPEPMYIDPADGMIWLRPVMLLTNRRVYSAANWFVSMVRHLPHVVQIGDSTGGGSGLPFSSELPNGWKVRFSASPMLDAGGNQVEFGVPPHLRVNIIPEVDFERGGDNIIEAARVLLEGYLEGRNKLK